MPRWTPSNWASRVPFGFGNQRPNNYAEVFHALRENVDELPFAWRILTQGVCDGCALGTTGLRDWTLDGVHLCNIRLRLLRLNTMPALDIARLADVTPLRALSGAELRDLGRLPYPMLRRRGESGFRRITWDETLDLTARRIRASSPERVAFYLTSRGIPNEAYYAAQKSARAIGTNNIDNAARVCHSPSTVALKSTIGAAASTCSYKDWLKSDLLVFIGSNVANNQPVATKYIHFAKKNGARVVTINPYREPGMERYWIPSNIESALFGTKITDRFFLINVGGDVAFLSGALKRLIELNALDESFIRDRTIGYEDLHLHLDTLEWTDLERASGSTRAEMEAFGEMLASARRAVLVWSMGITQHECGVENVRAIVNLALARGFIGREGCGLMPIRGHSGVQGGAEMGCYSTAFPGGLAVNAENAKRLGEHWGFDVPTTPGMTAPEMIDAAADGKLDVLFSCGGNFLDVLPQPSAVESALARIPLRVHMDIVLSSSMLVEPGEDVLLLPAATRYETPGGVTETSTERRVIFSPEIAGRRIGEARPEIDVFPDLARRVRPEIANRLTFNGPQAIRDEIARVIPFYDGIQRLERAGDEFQYGGPHLCAGGNFPTPDGKARFSVVAIPSTPPANGSFRATTRRGKQFNSMVHESADAITGVRRDEVIMNSADAARLGLRNGDAIRIHNGYGELRGRARLAEIAPGNIELHWPEANVLIDAHRRAAGAGVPDYNASVRIEKV